MSVLRKKAYLTPSPSTMQEIQYIYRNLLRIAPIQSFVIDKKPIGYDNMLHVTFNLSRAQSVDPFEEPGEDSSHLPAIRSQISQYLNRIVAIPKFQYIDNDNQYLEGKSQVPFNHKLAKGALRYLGTYTVTKSTVASPFCLIEPGQFQPGQNQPGQMQPEVLSKLKKDIRCNFETFTKVDFWARDY